MSSARETIGGIAYIECFLSHFESRSSWVGYLSSHVHVQHSSQVCGRSRGAPVLYR